MTFIIGYLIIGFLIASYCVYDDIKNWHIFASYDFLTKYLTFMSLAIMWPYTLYKLLKGFE